MEYENDGPAPLTLKQQPKVFGAPPTKQKGEAKKSKTGKSGIPTKKGMKASKSPTLVVCSASNHSTPFEKQRLVLGKQNPTTKQNREKSVQEEDDDVEVIRTSAPVKRFKSPEKVKKFCPHPTKKEEEIVEPEQESDDDVITVSSLKRNKGGNKHRHPEKTVRIVEEAQDEDDDEFDDMKEDDVIYQPADEIDEEPKEEIDEAPIEDVVAEPVEEQIEEQIEEPAEEQKEEVKEVAGKKKHRKRRHHHAKEQNENSEENKEDAQEAEENQEEMKDVPTTPRADGKKQGPEDEEQSSATSLFDGVLEEMKESANGAMQKIAQWQSDLLEQLIPLEDQQIQYWYLHTRAYLEQQKICFDQNKTEFYDNIAELVDVLMVKHRIYSVNRALHRMRILITGPRYSGKSTLLAIAAERALIELAASGEWKKTFIFAYDFDSNAHNVKSIDMLYKNIVKATFNGLAAQRPLVEEHVGALCRCFCDIIEGTPLLPKAFTISNDFRQLVPQLQQLISIISECWAEGDSKDGFITNALTFPLQIAKIFGFERQLVIADHFDAFALGTTVEEIFIMENVKALLDLSSFIAASQVQEKVSEIIKPGQADGVDLTQSIFRLSTLDVVEDDEYSDREYSFHINDSSKHFNINSTFFGGCPAFLKLWYELNELFDEIEKEEKEEKEEEEDFDDEKIEELEEKRILLSNKAGEILNALTEGSNEFVVTAVTKVHKK